MIDSALSRIATQPVVSHAEMANAIRFLAIDAVENAKSGHPRHADGDGRCRNRTIFPLP